MTGAAIRLSALYGGMFLVIGIMMPFWPVWLEAKGLSPSEIGLVIAAGSIVRVFVGPFTARIADRTGERKRPMVILSILGLLMFLPFALVDSFWAILLLQALFAGMFGPMMPLSESLTMTGAKQDGLDYGRIRLWGSITFIIGASGVGFFLKGADPSLIWTSIAIAFGIFALVTLMIPDYRVAPGKPDSTPIRQVLRDKTFLIFIVATACIQGSHGLMYTFGTLNWLRIGFDEWTIGLLWAEGVIAEVILFVFAAGVVRKIGPARLIALAGLAALVRWTAMGLTDDLWMTVALQLLHAFTFGAAHLGAVYFIADRMPEDVSATAQTLYALTVSGIGIGLTSYISGHLYEAFAAQAYFAMAAMGGMGMLLAWHIRRRH